MTEVPATASGPPGELEVRLPDLPPAGPGGLAAWLTANHDTACGVWVASEEGQRARRVAYEELVEEAICFGWIDSTVNILDDERGLQLMTPRKPKSGWTRLNRDRFATLEAEGRMTDAGRRAAEVAKANGWWTIYDLVEDMIEPDDLAEVLDASPAARPRGTASAVGSQADAVVGRDRRPARDPGEPHRRSPPRPSAAAPPADTSAGTRSS